jgi:tRNA A-37 threonylcarbamoyl transferase component Bud32
MTGYECPYVTGAEFVLILTDIQNESICRVRVKVLRTYPFTKSQAMEVGILHASPGYRGCLPPVAFLKLFDRRFLDDRSALGDNPWDYEKEAKANKIHSKIQPQFVEPDIHVKSVGLLSTGKNNKKKIVVSEVIDFDEDDYKKEIDLCPDIDAVNQWIIEMEYRHHTISWFNSECRAYRQLRTLQAFSVPTFYGTTLFDETSELPLNIDTDVRGILLEFIDGINLEEIDIQSSLSTQYPYIAEAAHECFNKIVRFGVIHNDVRLANIMVNNVGRIYLIDFAFALFRGEDVSDEDWDKCAAEQGEALEAKFLLHEKGLRDKTPPEPHSNDFGDYTVYNSLIRNAPEAWRLKYYKSAPFGERLVLEGLDQNGIVSIISLPGWLPKYKAMAERKIYLNRMRLQYRELFEPDDLVECAELD